MKKHKIILIIMVLVIIAGVGFGWHYGLRGNQSTAGKVQAVVSVEVAQVKKAKMEQTVYAVGTLQAQQHINVAPQMDGKISAILYQPGSYVKKGTVLFQLDDRIYQARMHAAQSALQLAKMNFERALKLAKTGVQSAQELDKVRAVFQQAQAALVSDNTILSEAQILADFSAYVGPQLVSVGDYVQKGQTLTSLTDRSSLLVHYHLPERYLQKIKLKQKIEVMLPEHKEQVFEGGVSYISPTVDATTHSFSVEANIPNKNNRLAPGLFVKVRHVLGENLDALVVPINSLVSTITGSEVYRIRNHQAEVVSVTTGATMGNQVEIVKGLNSGDVVVTSGQQQLLNGSRVREVNSP
jgi:membrane fusion protein, multidrug efflux system